MTDFRTLPTDAKRELAYNAMALTLACTALSNLTAASPEYWATHLSGEAYHTVREMTDAQINEVVEAIEQQRQHGYGVMKVDIDRPKGFGK